LQINVILLNSMIKCYATYILTANFSRRAWIHFAPFSKFAIRETEFFKSRMEAIRPSGMMGYSCNRTQQDKLITVHLAWGEADS